MSRDRRNWRGKSALADGNGPSGDVRLDKTLLRLGQEAFVSTGDTFYQWSLTDDSLVWAPNAGALLGISSEGEIATGRNFAAKRVFQKGTSRYEEIVSRGLRDNGSGVPYAIEYAICDDSGTERWLEDRGRWFGDAEGRPLRAVGIVRHVSDRRRADDKLRHLATCDELTGHPNRTRLKELLGDYLAGVRQARNGGAYFVVAIDNLALINEAYGFDIADRVIVEVGERLHQQLRRTDTIGRSSGNKFGILLGECDNDQMTIMAERLLNAVGEVAIEMETGPVATTVSIGCVALPSEANTAQGAMMRAEEALSDAKSQRTSSFSAFNWSRERDDARRTNLKLADELVAALNERRLQLAFQPLVSSETLEPVMHEGLLRLMQEDGNAVSAYRFIPIAEKLGLIRLIDHRVLELAFDELSHDALPSLSINVSGHTIADREWLDMLVALARNNSSAADRLVVEITETVAIQDMEGCQEFVRTARDHGVRIAIDDFGAGYTSFRNLRQLEVDMVKIDGSYIQDLTNKPDNQVFVQSFLSVTRNLGLTTVAEFVSNESEVAYLKGLGVDLLQGYFLGEPELKPGWRIRGADTDLARRAT